mmetsp:Transcript_140581/g.365860  ORF Transcript_140581/g.365860 Transcript_140581/m.365860 type:complete len:225 (+) Transcript_140581:2217-2891(+)
MHHEQRHCPKVWTHTPSEMTKKAFAPDQVCPCRHHQHDSRSLLVLNVVENWACHQIEDSCCKMNFLRSNRAGKLATVSETVLADPANAAFDCLLYHHLCNLACALNFANRERELSAAMGTAKHADTGEGGIAVDSGTSPVEEAAEVGVVVVLVVVMPTAVHPCAACAATLRGMARQWVCPRTAAVGVASQAHRTVPAQMTTPTIGSGALLHTRTVTNTGLLPTY